MDWLVPQVKNSPVPEFVAFTVVPASVAPQVIAVALQTKSLAGGTTAEAQVNDKLNALVVEYPLTLIQYTVPRTDGQEKDADRPAHAGPLSSTPPIHVKAVHVAPEYTCTLLSQAVAHKEAVMV
jgi:hypothetical protein